VCYNNNNNNNNNCGSLRTEDEVEGSQHWCGNVASHRPEEGKKRIKVLCSILSGSWSLKRVEVSGQ